MKIKIIIAISLFFLLSACATIKTPMEPKINKTSNIDSAYIVNTNASSQKMVNAVKRSLLRRGINANTGPTKKAYKDVDIYIKCNDSWYWDLATYLMSFDITIYETGSNEVLGSVTYDNTGFFHDFPDTEEKVEEAIELLFQKENVSNIDYKLTINKNKLYVYYKKHLLVKKIVNDA